MIHDVGNPVVEGHEEFRAGLETLGDPLGHVHVEERRLANGRNPP